jgi:hypothetical protein
MCYRRNDITKPFNRRLGKSVENLFLGAVSYQRLKNYFMRCRGGENEIETLIKCSEIVLQ